MFYRVAPSHSIYQGDLVVVPVPTIECDPQIVRNDGPTDTITGKRPKTFGHVSGRIQKGEQPFEANDEESTVTRVRVSLAVLLSHSCDVDRRAMIRFLGVRPLSKVSDRTRERLKTAGIVGPTPDSSLLYLPSHGRLPEAVIDLDLNFSLSRDHLGRVREFESSREGRKTPCLVPYKELIASRVTSLGEQGLRRLYEAVFRHLARPSPLELDLAQGSPSALDDDPDRPRELPERGWWWPTPSWLR